MNFFRKSIAIISEIVILILSFLWYLKTKDYEPLIAIIATSVALLVGILSNILVRPRLMLHRKKNNWGRSPRGYTVNNPAIITVGVDNPEQYWELDWNYELEIRNNSSQTAYNIEVEYQNLPPKTFINGEIGKIEPLISLEKRIFKIKLVQNITGTHIDADRYLEHNADTLTQNLIIKLKYTDESGMTYYTIYCWLLDENKLKIFCAW